MRAAPFLTARWSPLLPARPSCSDGERLYVVGEHYYWRVRPTVHVHITAHCARRASPVSMRRPGLRCGSRSLSRRRRSLASSRRLPHGMTRRSWRCGRTGRRARTRSCPSGSPARLPTSRPRAATSPAPPSSPRVRSTASCAARLGQHRKECVKRSADRRGDFFCSPGPGALATTLPRGSVYGHERVSRLPCGTSTSHLTL